MCGKKELPSILKTVFLAMQRSGALLGSDLKRRYINLRNEWMNPFTELHGLWLLNFRVIMESTLNYRWILSVFFLWLSVCQSVCLSACLFVCLSVCLYVCLSAYLFVTEMCFWISTVLDAVQSCPSCRCQLLSCLTLERFPECYWHIVSALLNEWALIWLCVCSVCMNM